MLVIYFLQCKKLLPSVAELRNKAKDTNKLIAGNIPQEIEQEKLTEIKNFCRLIQSFIILFDSSFHEYK